MQNKAIAEPIAIIAASCRFPGQASNLDSFWSLLENGVDAVTQLPDDRFCFERFCSNNQNLAGYTYTRSAGVLEKIKDFDPDFFGIARKEAQYLDPQQRILLELTWETLENAFILPSSLRGSDTAVFVGASNMDLSQQGLDDPARMSAYSMTSSTLSVISNRISYLFDFHGPSMTVDTACSSSLVAVHLACEALRNGQASLAVAGGINILLTPIPFIGFSRAKMLSPDGRCKVFDASGNGYVRSEGGGVILLKPLKAALKDGDTVLALIGGSGVNSDGRTTGISLPNGKAQATLLQNVYKTFNLDKNKLAYVEAHGTGTAAGDPIEANAIGTVLGKPLQKKRQLYIGSVKSNIGHMESAAGMAGIIKGLLILQNEIIPPNIHLHTPNPAIDFKKLNIQVPIASAQLPQLGGEELISINSFGFGGTNAHIVLQKAPVITKKTTSAAKHNEHKKPAPLFISARSKKSLCKLAGEFSICLESTDNLDTVYNIAATCALHREQLKYRTVLSCESLASLKSQLRKLAKEQDESLELVSEAVAENTDGVFAFSGNGSQWCGMGTALIQSNKYFAAAIKKVDDILHPLQGWSIQKLLLNPEQNQEAFDYTEKSQPLLFAVQVALVMALQEKGIRPAAVLGHSVGEVAAAWACGALSLEDAATVIHYRSMLQAKLRDHGHMAVANLAPATAEQLLAEYNGKIEIAAINSEKSLTLAGDGKALRRFVKYCKQHSVSAKMLDLPYPFHTKAMDLIKDEIIQSLQCIKPLKAKIPFFSTAIKAGQKFIPDGEYWWHNVRQPVCFAEATQHAIKNGYRIFLEIGPHSILGSYIRNIIRQEGVQARVSATMKRDSGTALEFEESWKTAWKNGWNLDLRKHFKKPYQKTRLPNYAWNKEYFWPENTSECRNFLETERLHPLLGWALPGKASVFENTINISDASWLKDHAAGSSTPYPAAAFIESMLAAAENIYPGKSCQLERVTLFRPLQLTEATPKVIRLSVDREDGGLLVEAKSYLSQEPFGTYARGRIVAGVDTQPLTCTCYDSPEKFGVEVSKTALYNTAKKFFLAYGPAFQTVERAWVRTDSNNPEVLSALSIPEEMSAEGMLIPPTLLDGAFQTLFILLGANELHVEQNAYLPAAFEKILLCAAGRPRYALAKLERVSPRSVVASFKLFDETGSLLLQLDNCRFRRAAWLEHENTASHPYRIDFELTPHFRAIENIDAINPASLCKEAESLLHATSVFKLEQAKNSIHPYLLLQLATLTAAHETVITLEQLQSATNGLNIEKLKEQGMLDPAYESWLLHMLKRLENNKLAEHNNGYWQIAPAGKRPSFTILWRTLLSSDPGYLQEANLLAHTFRRAPDILAGKYRTPEEILPAKMLDAYFNHALILQPFYNALGQCLQAALAQAGSKQIINFMLDAKDAPAVLSGLRPLLQKDSRLHCTVIARDAGHMEAMTINCGNIPGVKFCELENCLKPGNSYEQQNIIFSVYSLYSQENISGMLENYKQMLIPGGTLCVLEHMPTVFTDCIFGSAPAWWSASVDPVLPVSLLQTRTQWKKNLDEAGFKNVTEAAQENSNIDPAFLLFAQKDLLAEASQAQIANNHITESATPVTESEQPIRRWLLCTGDTKTGKHLGAYLAKALPEAGETLFIPAMINSSDAEQQAGTIHNSLDKNAWSMLLAQAQGAEQLNIVYLGGYDTATELTLTDVAKVQESALCGLTSLAQACADIKTPLCIWVVTGGGLSPAGSQVFPVPTQGTLTGFTRVLMQEMRGLNIRLIDLHGHTPELSSLMRELLYPASEQEIVLAGKLRYVPRLDSIIINTKNKNRKNSITGATLTFDAPGRLQNLYWKQIAVASPGSDEICVEVKTTGLNFRDVMWSMGMLQDEALETGFSGPGMGIECAGVVTAVGSNVKNLKPEDEVLCFAPNCFSTHVVTRANAAVKKPEHINFNAAATIPVTFMTAWYSIKHLAAMQPGESILIHGAAGGVGLAAIQIASYLGLEIYATAGSQEKHNFLQQLGITNLFSSRSLNFAQQIMEATQGRGVDVVLNSLAGEAITAGISVLRPFGRFIELGKRDFYADTPLRLRPFSNNLSYFGVDVDQLLVYQPELGQKLFLELVELFHEHKLAPIPYTVFPATKTVDAFQLMQQSGHTGKLVLDLTNAEKNATPPQSQKCKLKLNKDATYIVTGGTSGFGLATAERLAGCGAKHLLLLSRSGVKDKTDEEVVNRLCQTGVKVYIEKIDIANERKLNSLLKTLQAKLPPFKGIVHAAAVLDDGMIAGLTPDRIKNALAAKTLGAWNLHRAPSLMQLDFFVMYSSATTAFGNPGQSSYVAANSMLETLAAFRRSQKLPAQVIGWGPISDTGMFQRNAKAQQLLQNMLGVSPVSSQEALDWLEHCISADVPDSHYFGIDWQNRGHLPALASERFSRLRPYKAASQFTDSSPLERIQGLEPKEAKQVLTAILLEEVANVLRMPHGALTNEAPLVAQGMDSLMAVELGMAIEQKFALSGYTPNLSEKTTASSLAADLYSLLTGSSTDDTPETELTMQSVNALTQKHGFRLSDTQGSSILTEIEEKKHE